MPCWQRRIQTLNFARVDFDILVDSFKSRYDARSMSIVKFDQARGIFQADVFAGGGYTVTLDRGKLTIGGPRESSIESATKALAQDYTKRAFKAAAKKAGFSVKTNRKGRLEATKRRYTR